MDIALRNDYLNIISFLINKIEIDLEKEKKMFSKSVEEGFVDIVKFFINRNRVNINEKDEFGDPILCLCSRLENIDMFNLLLDSGANVNDSNDNDEEDISTPLDYCIDSNNINGIKQMIRCNVNVNAKCSKYPNAIFAAAQRYRVDILKLLLTNCYYDLEMVDENGNTVLHKTILRNVNLLYKKIIKLLIKAGARLDTPNDKGITPLESLKSRPDINEYVMKKFF